MTKIKIDLIKIEKDLYPRTELDQENVNHHLPHVIDFYSREQRGDR